MDIKPNAKRVASLLANGVLVTGGLAGAIALSYFFYHYQILHDRHFAGSVGKLLYYAAPAVLIVVSCGALFRNPNFRIKTALCFIAAGASVYLMEGFLRVQHYIAETWPTEIDSQDNVVARAKFAKRLGIDFDRRSRFDVIQDLRRAGVDAVPQVEPNFFMRRRPDGSWAWNTNESDHRPYPLGGVSNKTVVFCNEIGPWAIYQSDEHGFRNRPGAWSPHSMQIAAIGDSIAHGACIPSDGHFMGLIQHAEPWTLNLAITGMGPISELAVLKEYAQAARPKILLWMYSEATDVTDLAAEQNNPVLMQYLRPDFTQHLLSRQQEIDEEWTQLIEKAEAEIISSRRRRQQEPHLTQIRMAIREVLLLPRLRQKLGLVYGRPDLEEEIPSETDPKLLAMFERTLSEAKKITEGWGGSMYFVYLPEWVRYAHPAAAVKNRELILQIVKRLGIHLIDVSTVFANQRDPLELFPFRGYGHYSEAGNQLVAKTILASIPFDQLTSDLHSR